MFEATDLKHAIQLMSKNPAVKSRIVEIRLAENLAELIRESERRRATSLAVYETREQIAGYFLIHAKDRDETIGLTQRSTEGGKCGLTFGGGAIF